MLVTLGQALGQALEPVLPQLDQVDERIRCALSSECVLSSVDPRSTSPHDALQARRDRHGAGVVQRGTEAAGARLRFMREREQGLTKVQMEACTELRGNLAGGREAASRQLLVETFRPLLQVYDNAPQLLEWLLGLVHPAWLFDAALGVLESRSSLPHEAAMLAAFLDQLESDQRRLLTRSRVDLLARARLSVFALPPPLAPLSCAPSVSCLASPRLVSLPFCCLHMSVTGLRT